MTWGVRGRTPIIRVPGQRQSVSAASAVNARGGFWFATAKGGITSGLFEHRDARLDASSQEVLGVDPRQAVRPPRGRLEKNYVEVDQRKARELHFCRGHAVAGNPIQDELGVELHEENWHSRYPLKKGRLYIA